MVTKISKMIDRDMMSNSNNSKNNPFNKFNHNQSKKSFKDILQEKINQLK